MRSFLVLCCLCLLFCVGVSAVPTSSEVSREELMRNILRFIQRQQQEQMENKYVQTSQGHARSLDLGLQRDYSARALGLGMLARQLVDSQYGAGKRSV